MEIIINKELWLFTNRNRWLLELQKISAKIPVKLFSDAYKCWHLQRIEEKCRTTKRYNEICREKVEMGKKMSLCTRKFELKFVRKYIYLINVIEYEN
jgi:hypothetical protein